MLGFECCYSVRTLDFFFQAEDGIRDLVRSRGLGDVYKRQDKHRQNLKVFVEAAKRRREPVDHTLFCGPPGLGNCLLYTSDAADERSSVDLGGRRIIKKKTEEDSLKTQPEDDEPGCR